MVGRDARALWRGPGGEPGPVLQECLEAAIAAPSVHNTQPWLSHLRHRGVDVYADWSRQVPVIDPSGRELLISVGAAVFNLRVAIRAYGRRPLQLLQPMPPAPGLIARISPGAPATVPDTVRALAAAIPRRHTNRWPFADTALPGEVLAELATAARLEGATLRVMSRHARRYVLELVRAAEHQWCEDPTYRAELARWTDDLPNRRDGIPPTAVGPRVTAGGLPLRDFGLTHPNLRRKKVKFESPPTIAVLYADDTPEQWLRTGQALQRTLLAGTAHGVAATLMTQPLEVPWFRDLMPNPHTGQPAQAIIRFGYSSRAVPRSPRRPLAEFLHEPTSTADPAEWRHPSW